MLLRLPCCRLWVWLDENVIKCCYQGQVEARYVERVCSAQGYVCWCEGVRKVCGRRKQCSEDVSALMMVSAGVCARWAWARKKG